jgi:hypothetical protein
MERLSSRYTRLIFATCATFGLSVMFIVQYADFLNFLTGQRLSPHLHFIFNRAIRILINDTCMLVIIFAIFHNRHILRLAVVIQLLDLFVLFPIYAVLKFYFEGVSELSSPFLSQFHRLIVNPTLMFLLIAGLFYQKIRDRGSSKMEKVEPKLPV